MSKDIRVPTLGESVTEATIAKWFKKEGDAVKIDEPLVELETDKVTVEVPAPASGKLEKINAAAGMTIAVGALLGSIAEGPLEQLQHLHQLRNLWRQRLHPLRRKLLRQRSRPLCAKLWLRTISIPLIFQAPAKMAASPPVTLSPSLKSQPPLLHLPRSPHQRRAPWPLQAPKNA